MKTIYIFLFFAFFSTPIFSDQTIRTKEGFIESDGAKIYYKRIGEGDPIIMVHGGPGQNHTFFLPQCEALAKNHELIFYDQRGSGNSSENFSFEHINLYQFVDDLEKLRSELKLERFTLLGHSWGAIIAYQYASKHPEALSHLVLLNPIPASSQDLSSFAAEFESRLKNSRGQLENIQTSEAFLSGDIPTIESFYKKLFVEFFYDKENLSKLHFSLNKEFALQDFIVYRIFEETLYKPGYDFKLKLSQIKVPTLILHGDYDPIPQWTAKEIANKIPNAQYKVLKECGHFSYIEKPNEVFSEINKFIK